MKKEELQLAIKATERIIDGALERFHSLEVSYYDKKKLLKKPDYADESFARLGFLEVYEGFPKGYLEVSTYELDELDNYVTDVEENILAKEIEEAIIKTGLEVLLNPEVDKKKANDYSISYKLYDEDIYDNTVNYLKEKKVKIRR